MTASDMISELDTVIRCFDQPFAASASTWFLSGRAHSDVKAVLSGDGADELFGSYPLQQLAFPMQFFAQMKANGLSPADMDPALLAPFSDRSDFLANLYNYSGGSEVRLSYRMLNMTDDEKALFLSDEVFGELISKKKTLLQLREIFSSLSGARCPKPLFGVFPDKFPAGSGIKLYGRALHGTWTGDPFAVSGLSAGRLCKLAARLLQDPERRDQVSLKTGCKRAAPG